MATKRTRKPAAPVAVVNPPGRRLRAKALGDSNPKFSDSMPLRGASQQIPISVIDKAAHETIIPPLGSNSFEELTGLLVDSADFSSTVEQISTDVAGLGWHLDQINQETKMDQGEITKAMTLLAGPQRSMLLGEILMLGEIIKRAVMDYLVLGNAWIEVVRESNNPGRPPSGFAHAPGVAMRLRANLYGHVMLAMDTNKFAFFRPIFSDPRDARVQDPRTGEAFNEMMYFKKYSPGSPWYGVPRIVPAMRAIKGSLFSSERNIRFFLNRAMPEWTVIVSGETDDIPDTEIKQFETDIEEYFRNVLKGDDYRTLVMHVPAGIKVDFQKVSIDVNDAGHPEYRKSNRDEILRAYGMPPNRLGIIESGNLGGGSGESQIEIYKTSTVKPPQEMLERQFNAILHADEPMGLGIKTLNFKFDEIDSIDEQREANIAATLAGTGWLTVNEGRKYASQFLKINLDEIPEPWADLPLQMVVPQLATLLDPISSMQEEGGGFRPGVTPLGTPGLPAMSPFERNVIMPTLAVEHARKQQADRRPPSMMIDRAYAHERKRRGAEVASENGA